MSIENEEMFFDKRAQKILDNQQSLIVDNPNKFLAGSSVAFKQLESLVGDIQDKVILDYGCGSGWLSTYLAKKGATVYGFDVSSKLIEVGKKRAEQNNVRDKIKLQKMVAENLEYSENLFDFVIGISILHHVDYNLACKELRRVMKNDGRAIFIEPLGENPIMNFIRSIRIQTEDEHPLKNEDIEKLKPYFNTLTETRHQLLGAFEKVIGYKLTNFFKLEALDNFLINKFPSLKKFYRLIVIELRNE